MPLRFSQTRNSLKVSQPNGLKTTSCAAILFGPAVAWRTVYFFISFKSEARGSRINNQPSRVPVRLSNKERQAPKQNLVFPSHQLTAEAVANPYSKGGARPPFDLLEYFQEQRGTQSKRRNTLIPKKAQNVQNVFKQTNYSSDQALYSKETKLGLTNSLPSEPSFTTSACHFNFSHHIPLLHCHSPSTAREKGFPCCDDQLHQFGIGYRRGTELREPGSRASPIPTD